MEFEILFVCICTLCFKRQSFYTKLWTCVYFLKYYYTFYYEVENIILNTIKNGTWKRLFPSMNVIH